MEILKVEANLLKINFGKGIILSLKKAKGAKKFNTPLPQVTTVAVKKEQLTKKWYFVKEINSKKQPNELDAAFEDFDAAVERNRQKSIYFHYKTDGVVEAVLSDEQEKGTWELSEDNREIGTQFGIKRYWKIIQISDTSLFLNMGDSPIQWQFSTTQLKFDSKNTQTADGTTEDTIITNSTYLATRKLLILSSSKKVKSPQASEPFKKVNGSVKLVHYKSTDNFQLQGLLDTTNITKNKKKAAILYLHGGFALGYADVADCKPFTEAGYIVFAPSYRGENGNEGNYELFGREVNDAKQALLWLSEQPFVNKDSIFVFGHSIGGGMSLHLAMYPELPINQSGSSAGLYGREDFAGWAENNPAYVPFNVNTDFEVSLRCPLYHLSYLPRPHQMYIGTDDDFAANKDYLEQLYKDEKLKLNLVEVEGDHFSSLEKAMFLFLKQIK